MKKLFRMLLVLFILYLAVQFAFNFFSKGDSNKYIITKGNAEFEVQEQSYFAGGKNTYSYSVKIENMVFNFQIDEDFNKSNQVLKDIKYYKDENHKCILPIFKHDKIVIDMICFDGKVTTYYYNVKGQNKKLDNFVSEISEYDVFAFTDKTMSENIENVSVYTENLIKDHYLITTNYKGIYDISINFNSKVYDISLFGNDVESQNISALVDNYYIVANYNAKKEFDKFYIIDIIRLDKETMDFDQKISLNSYIQGVVDNKLYIYDYDNKIQYEINVEKRTIVAYSGNNLKYYDKGMWTTMTISQADQGLKFKYEEQDFFNNIYDRIDKNGKEVGYYYLYMKNGNKYDVYSMDIQNKDSVKYLFSTKTIDNIYYIDDYVYFLDDSIIKVFNHEFGVKNIAKFNKQQLNGNFTINVYSK